ncbi:hypothetical protein [uncultured Actinomyces sp.]|uniref:hypothetical protein n=1 Tax=uncultured Actinomyces sp. TaxID=249061 RepID=UPI0028EF9299|nr:hypothetical protein [uncultured Actinomyces sp.]
MTDTTTQTTQDAQDGVQEAVPEPGKGEAPTSSAAASTVPEGGFVAPSSQEELNRIIEARIARERRKYADYEDLKGQAARLADVQAELDELKAAQERSRWVDAAAKEYNVPADLLRGASKAEVDAHAKAIADALRQRPVMPVLQGQGKAPVRPAGDAVRRAWAREVFPRE